MGHAIRTWYMVCSEASHLQLSEKARSNFAWMNEMTQHQFARGLSLTQVVWRKLISGLVVVMGMNDYAVSHYTQGIIQDLVYASVSALTAD